MSNIHLRFDNGWTVSILAKGDGYGNRGAEVWAWDANGNNATPRPLFKASDDVAKYIAEIAAR